MEFSIIIPALDEADRIGTAVARCLSLRPRPEVIVADGESADGTRELAEAAGARVVRTRGRGRALQMNAGAWVSRGDILIFLHADVTLSQRSYDALLRVAGDATAIGGAFRRRFESPSRLLAFGCRLADARGRWLRIYLGDQAIFVRREAFRRLGGFPEILLFEDVAFSQAMARLGETRLIEEAVVASSRRFDREGNLSRLARNVALTALYLLGVHPDRLARQYYPGTYAGRLGKPAATLPAAGQGAGATTSNTAGVPR